MKKVMKIVATKLIIIAATIISMIFLTGFSYGNTPDGYTIMNPSQDIGKIAGVNFSTTLRVYVADTDYNPYNVGAVEWSDGGYFGPGTTIDPDYTMLYYRQATGYDNVPIYIYNTTTGTGGSVETDYVYIPQGAAITSIGTNTWLYKYNINAYNVTFDLNGAPGTPPTTQSVGSGYNPTAVTPPTWTNYNFMGWSPSQYAAAGNPAEHYTITQATTLYAIWKYTLYNVSYDTNGGNTISATLDTQALPSPLPTPTKTGYNFLGWFYDSEFTTLAVAGQAIDNDIVLYAKWQLQPLPTYTITYDTMGGEPIPQQYNMRALPSQLPIPIYDGHAFQGWYYDESLDLDNDIWDPDYDGSFQDVGRAKFVGFESWVLSNSLTNTVSFYCNGLVNSGLTSSDTTTAVSNIFIQKAQNAGLDEEYMRCTTNNPNRLLVNINKSRLTGWDERWTTTQKQDAFKTWLTTNNLIVFYKLFGITPYPTIADLTSWLNNGMPSSEAVAGAAIETNVTLYAKWRYIDPLNPDYIDGYDDGYATGYGHGYWHGYEDGYTQGGLDGIDIGWFRTVMSGIAVIFSMKIFGDITLATFIGIPLLFAIILWIKKLLG